MTTCVSWSPPVSMLPIALSAGMTTSVSGCLTGEREEGEREERREKEGEREKGRERWKEKERKRKERGNTCFVL